MESRKGVGTDLGTWSCLSTTPTPEVTHIPWAQQDSSQGDLSGYNVDITSLLQTLPFMLSPCTLNNTQNLSFGLQGPAHLSSSILPLPLQVV